MTMARCSVSIRLGLLTAALAAGCGANSVSTPEISVTVAPVAPTVTIMGTVHFVAAVTGTSAGQSKAVTWSVTAGGGTIGATTGAYVAPTTEGTFTVTAASVADPARTGIATVNVVTTPVIEVGIAPATVTVAAGGAIQFSATVTGTTVGQSMAVTWSVTAGGGSIGATTGAYVAPAAAGTFTVTATSVADTSRSGTAVVTVTVAGTILDQLRAIATKRVYFQHASVGGESVGVYQPPGSWPNPTWGLDKICKDNPSAGVSVLRSPSAPSVPPATPAAGQVCEWTHGSMNGNPTAKVAAFNTNVRQFTRAPDVAILKLGYPDVVTGGMAGTSPVMSQQVWFDTVYKPTLDALEASFPTTRFVHATMPLSPCQAYWGNDLREQWNARLRASYPGRVFDLGYWESVNRAGLRFFGADLASCLADDWNIPGDGHANQPGADWLGEKLLEFLAGLP
jgi:hypothetical protein